MRASRCAKTAALVAAICLRVELCPSQAGVSALDPAFRLPAGGVALAGPILDISPPVAVWLLSEDRSLYALTEGGDLAARVSLGEDPGTERPGSFLAVDPFGRVILSPAGSRLRAYTRIGSIAWQAPIEPVQGSAAAFPPAFGSDGRTFSLSGSGLVCLNPAGIRLWSLSLPAPASCPPGVDGRGYPVLGLADGRLILASPYGEVLRTLVLGSPPSAILPLTRTEGGELPLLAAGLADGRLILIGAEGETQSSYHCKAAPLSLAWDGTVLYGLDSSGEAFALSGGGTELWSVSTGCKGGRLYLFGGRLVAVGRGRAVSLSLKGETFRELTIPGASGIPVVSPKGLAFSSGSDWVLAAYRFERPLGLALRPDPPAYPGLPDLVSKELRFDPLAADSDRQLTRLADIEKSLRSGTIGGDEPEDAAYCAAVATGELGRDLPLAERRFAGNPLARSSACYLLGCLGSPEYRDPLFRVLRSDEDSAVRAAAVEALAFLGVDPDGASMSAFLAAAARPVDERTALDIAVAIETMALRSGLAPSGDGLRALIKLTATPYGQTVRNRAGEALGRISGALR